MKFLVPISFIAGAIMGFFISNSVSKTDTVSSPTDQSPDSPTEDPTSTSGSSQVKVVEKIVYQCPEDPADQAPEVPLFSKNQEPILKTNKESEIKVAWNSVKYATQYKVVMKNKKGKVLRSWRTPHTTLYLKDLPFDSNLEFTPYEVFVTAINKKGIAGDESLGKSILVKRVNSIVAPSIKSIVIED